uniref:Uncharacterized protein n=1 Tax=Arundo donax TaxID=35708 RepID=A0A0A8Z2Y4_ARUDO
MQRMFPLPHTKRKSNSINLEMEACLPALPHTEPNRCQFAKC